MTSTPRDPPGARLRRPWALVARALALVSPPFVLLILYLVVHRLGWIERNRHLAYERTLIVDLVLWWLLAGVLVAAVIHRRRVLAALRARAPAAIAVVVSTLASLAAAEVALRLLRGERSWRPFATVPSERLHHRNLPDARDRGMGGELVRTNGDGFRTLRTREEFRRFGTRIAVLGDSFTLGLGVEDDQAAPAVLEAELRRRLGSDDVAVLNTGVISYSPYLERLAFRDRVRAYAPGVTLLILDLNDLGDDYQYERHNLSGDHDDPRFDVPAARRRSLCERSALCQAAAPALARLALPFTMLPRLFGAADGGPGSGYYDFRLTVGGVEETDRFFVLRHPLAVTRPFFERTLGYVEAIAADARAAGSEFVLVVAPRYFHWNDRECPENWESFRYRVDEPYEFEYFRFFDSVRARLDFDVVSLLPAFEAAGEGPLVFAHDPHWNPAGHRLVGGALADYLIARRLVPAGPPPG